MAKDGSVVRDELEQEDDEAMTARSVAEADSRVPMIVTVVWARTPSCRGKT